MLDARDEGTSLTDSEVRDQVLVFLLAGHETTSTALTYTLHLLGQHPDVQHRVRAEVDTIAGDQALTAQDVPALGYTTMTAASPATPSLDYPALRVIARICIRQQRPPAYAEPDDGQGRNLTEAVRAPARRTASVPIACRAPDRRRGAEPGIVVSCTRPRPSHASR